MSAPLGSSLLAQALHFGQRSVIVSIDQVDEMKNLRFMVVLCPPKIPLMMYDGLV